MTTNPLLLLVALAVLVLVVVSRRGDTPWARAFRLYLWLGLFIIAVRVGLYVLVGYKTGPTVLLRLPQVDLPSWAAGITLLGDLRLESLLATVVDALRLAVMVAAVGAANALANPKRLLRLLPGALHDLGTAVVVSVTVAPQLADSVRRVSRARALRGESGRGVRALPRVALPVLEETLERSLLLASAMDGRGYGRRNAVTSGIRRATQWSLATALLSLGLGIYGLLDGTAPAWLGAPLVAVGGVLAVVGLRLGGRTVVRSAYRPDPWLGPEWLTAGSGLVAATAMVLTSHSAPDALVLPLDPLAVPALPLLPLAGLLVAAAPAFLTPEPPRSRRSA